MADHCSLALTLQGSLVVLNQPRKGPLLVGNMTYHFRRTLDPALYGLAFSPLAIQPDGQDIKTGDLVQLDVDLDLSGPLPESAGLGAAAAGPPGSLFVTSWAVIAQGGLPTLDPPAPSAVYYTGAGRLALRAVVWLVSSVCGEAVQGGMGVEDVAEVLFGPPAGAALLPATAHSQQQYNTIRSTARTPLITVNRLLEACSYGAVRMRRSDVTILDLDLPCSGVRASGASWNVTRGSVAPGSPPAAAAACGPNEVLGWMEYAQSTAVQQGAIDPSVPARRLLLLPPAGSLAPGSGALCPAWQHRGSFGCNENNGCDIWIRADRSNLLKWLVSELGSSMALRPATVSTVPTTATAAADPTCPMGAAAEGDFKCFSGPSSFKLLFSSAARRLDATNTALAQPITVQLPPAGTTSNNTLLIVPNWSLPTSPTATPYILYGQYRPPVGGDGGLPADDVLQGGLLVLHGVAAREPPAGTYPAPGSVLLATLAVGESYRYEAARVLVRLQSATQGPAAADPGDVTGGAASVVVCRYYTATETGGQCFDGIDNDCDGLVDSEDPDCTTALYGHR